jgi:hypothetical protein
MAAELSKKLLVKPDSRVLLVNAPIGYAKKLEPLPPGVTLTHKRGRPADVILAFVRDSAELKRLAPSFASLEEDAVLWVCYPKGASSTGTDLNRDTLHAAMEKHELIGVSLVAVDERWSAMRFRAAEDVSS